MPSLHAQSTDSVIAKCALEVCWAYSKECVDAILNTKLGISSGGYKPLFLQERFRIAVSSIEGYFQTRLPFSDAF